MRVLSLTGAVGMLLLVAPPNAANATPRARTHVAPARATFTTSRSGRSRFVTPSCSGGSEGHYAFDSGITFSTNNVSVFGQSNLAAGGDSGVFEGSANTICDYNSVIAGGYQNVVDSGSGNAPSGAAYSFIGSGQQNSLTEQFSFIGAGYQNANTSGYAFIGAGQANTLSGAQDGVIGGGASNTASNAEVFLGAGDNNSISGYGAFVGAGHGNVTSGEYSFVGSGQANTASGTLAFVGSGSTGTASGHESFVGAGFGNVASGEGSFIGAGGVLTADNPGNQVAGADSFIGDGDQNTVAASNAFLGSGNLNTISSAGNDSVLGGGYGNTMAGQKAVLAGGEANEVAGSFATVPGGYHDEAVGNESFAAGSQAEARYTGSFVWSDYVSGEKPVADSAAGEFVARASGGVYFFSNAGSSTGVHLAAGSGTWSSLSDRNAKTDIVPLDDASILAKVTSLPISAWQYKTERGVRHVGPMAQDFYAAFGVGEDDRHITSIDEDGVALAAIKALHRENDRLRSRFEDDSRRKDGEIVALREEMKRLEATLATETKRVR